MTLSCKESAMNKGQMTFEDICQVGIGKPILLKNYERGFLQLANGTIISPFAPGDFMQEKSPKYKTSMISTLFSIRKRARHVQVVQLRHSPANPRRYYF